MHVGYVACVSTTIHFSILEETSAFLICQSSPLQSSDVPMSLVALPIWLGFASLQTATSPSFKVQKIIQFVPAPNDPTENTASF